MPTELELLEGLRSQVEALQFKDEKALDSCRRRTEMLARRLFGDESRYIKDLEHIRFHPMVYTSSMTDEDYRPIWSSGKNRLLNLVNTMVEEISLFRVPAISVVDDGSRGPEDLTIRGFYSFHTTKGGRGGTNWSEN